MILSTCWIAKAAWWVYGELDDGGGGRVREAGISGICPASCIRESTYRQLHRDSGSEAHYDSLRVRPNVRGCPIAQTLNMQRLSPSNLR